RAGATETGKLENRKRRGERGRPPWPGGAEVKLPRGRLLLSAARAGSFADVALSGSEEVRVLGAGWEASALRMSWARASWSSAEISTVSVSMSSKAEGWPVALAVCAARSRVWVCQSTEL